jgi:phosphoribosyl 1,2-cyclic phosphodiesterase
MIVQSFGSGSSGNAMLIRAGTTSVLVDCGIGPRLLKRALLHHQISPDNLDAVLITHEHDDHVRGLASLLANRRTVHSTGGTARALGLQHEHWCGIERGSSIEIGDLIVTAIATSHDAAEPCGYSFASSTTRATLLTDLGETDDASLELIGSSDLIVIEANHDLHMLKSGPYPLHLKRRVQSTSGHLSNDDCGAFLARALVGAVRPRTIWLAHLSATNNRPEVAVRTVKAAFGSGCRHAIIALPRRDPGPVWSPGAMAVTEQLALFAD